MPGRRRARSTASRRPARLRSTPSAERRRPGPLSLIFGTDGIRGLANAELTPEFVLALGRATARVLGAGSFLVGRDTRISGPLLQAALSAGLAAEGATVIDVGVLPTPGVAALAAARNLPAAVISASHNPYPDNGIKLFASGGRKLSDDVEARLEAELQRVGEPGSTAAHPTGASVGTLTADTGAGAWYSQHVAAALEGRRLDGASIVIDCACGSASPVAAGIFASVGATVDVLFDQPNGTNINDGCGSTHPEALQERVAATGANLGLAFDGDADWIIAVDHRGRLVDGDALIALFALDRRDPGRLGGDTAGRPVT